jgi:hypothetical protein
MVDDSVRKVRTAADVVAWRAMLIYYIFGFAGIPNWFSTVTRNVTCPLTALTNLRRTDLLSYAYPATSTTGLAIQVHLFAWHLIPSTTVKNRAVIYCPGHLSIGLDDDHTAAPTNIGSGEWRMISSLLAAGFDVFVYPMPAFAYDAGVVGIEPNWHADTGDVPFPYTLEAHEWLAQFTPHYRSIGSFHRFFLTMPVLCLNYAASLGRITDYAAVGISGGGWSTTWMAALDTRIAKSYSVAGTQPIYMRPATGALGDAEQVWPECYQGCGYLDLYMLATHNKHHEQIYNYADDGTFGVAQYALVEAGRVRCNGLTYEQAIADWSGEIAAAVAAIGTGTFSTTIDYTSNSHQNSWQTCAHVVSDLLTAG